MLYNTSETLHFRNVVCVNALDSRPAWACLRSGGARVELWKTFCHLYRIMRHRSAIFASDMLIRNL